MPGWVIFIIIAVIILVILFVVRSAKKPGPEETLGVPTAAEPGQLEEPAAPPEEEAEEPGDGLE